MWSQLKTILFLGVLSAIAVGAASFVAPQGVLVFAGAAVLLNLGAYFFSDRLVLRMHRARRLAAGEQPGLAWMATELAGAARIPPPDLYVIDSPVPNAFATGRGPGHAAIAVTTGLLERLSPRELRGVIAHEMAHVAHRDVLIASVAAALAAGVSGIANALQWSALFGGSSDDRDSSPGAALAFAITAPIAAWLVQLAISRSREFVADERAARLTQDPEGLASALLALSAAPRPAAIPAPATASLFIVNPLAGGEGLATLFSTHPPIAERVRRLRQLALGLPMVEVLARAKPRDPSVVSSTPATNTIALLLLTAIAFAAATLVPFAIVGWFD